MAQNYPNINGERIFGHLDLDAATTSEASLRIRQGVSPTSPAVGSMWNETTGYGNFTTVGSTTGTGIAIKNVVSNQVTLMIDGANFYVQSKLGGNGAYTQLSMGVDAVRIITNPADLLLTANSSFRLSATGGLAYDATTNHQHRIGSTATNYGTRLDATGFRIGQYSTLATSNTRAFEFSDATSNAGFYWDSGYLRIFNSSQIGLYSSVNVLWNNGLYTVNLALRTADSAFGNVLGNGAFEIANNSTTGMVFGNTSNAPIVIGTNGAERVRVAASGELSVKNLVGTGNRLLQTDSAGQLSASTGVVDMEITDATTINDITTVDAPSNWTGVNYTGPALTGVSKGQFYCRKTNNIWIYHSSQMACRRTTSWTATRWTPSEATTGRTPTCPTRTRR
jgi:hypothetical protein